MTRTCAACLHTNQSRSCLNHLVLVANTRTRDKLVSEEPVTFHTGVRSGITFHSMYAYWDAAVAVTCRVVTHSPVREATYELRQLHTCAFFFFFWRLTATDELVPVRSCDYMV
jgi:hypothetical protein